VLVDRVKNRIDNRIKNKFTEDIVLKYADLFKDTIGDIIIDTSECSQEEIVEIFSKYLNAIIMR
jgi:cytidylate kinase